MADWRLLLATAGYGLGAMALALLHGQLQLRFSGNVMQWYLEHILLPLLRVALLLLFFHLAGSSLYGTSLPADPGAVMGARLNFLLNLLFMLSLLLPLLLRDATLAVPLQAMILMALVTDWLAHGLGVTVDLLPGAGTILLILAWSLGGLLLTRWLSGHLGQALGENLRLSGVEAVLFEGLLLPAQLPGLMVYGGWLGAQLRP